jgi:hypothetical protein
MSDAHHQAASVPTQVASFQIRRETLVELAVAIDRARGCLQDPALAEHQRLRLREATDELEMAWATVVSEIARARAQEISAPALRLALRQSPPRDPEVHDFVVIYRPGALKPWPRTDREESRSYRGTIDEARAAAGRWLMDDGDILRVVSESGEVVAERSEGRSHD